MISYLLHDYQFRTIVLFNATNRLLFPYLRTQYIHWLYLNLLLLHLDINLYKSLNFTYNVHDLTFWTLYVWKCVLLSFIEQSLIVYHLYNIVLLLRPFVFCR